ncbi:MAG TPA: ATP-binding protein [Stellaceae bacterium]|jgi:PAS domain S-box-containing protein|nr:ATP-binding protein [Stellaceae bacterium]
MNLHAGVERRFHSSLRLPLVGIIVVAGIVLAATIAIWNRRDDAIARSRREMSNLGVVLAAQSARSLQAVDLVMQEAQALVRTGAITTPSQFRERLATEEVHKYLSDRLRSLPQANAVSLIDDTGRIINFSRVWPVPRIETADRDFYAHFRNTDDHAVFIGEPVVNKYTGAWVITLTRRIDTPDGTFLGIVLGVVEVRYFEEFYQTIAINPGESVALLRRDGTMLVRYPGRAGEIGKRLPPQAEWYGYAARGEGATYRSPGHFDQVPRIVSVHPVGDLPLVAAVAIEENAVLSDWRRQSTWMLLGALAAAVGFALLFRALAGQSRRLERQAKDLEEAAAALGQSEARFRDFATTSSDWLWETDAEHRFTYHSDNIRAFGQDPQKRLGRTRFELAADAGSEADKWAEHRAVLDRHEPFRDFVYKRQAGDDPEAYISVSGKPIFDTRRGFLGYRGTVRDISREKISERGLRAAKSAAEAANLAKSQFLANMSHELRTPLNAILGFSEMLKHGLAGPLQPQQQEYSGLIHQSGEHLLNVINEILDLARVDAGKLELHEEQDVDPQIVIDSCIRLVNARTDTNMPCLSVDSDDEIAELVVDPTRLTQILLNLLSNAVKFTPREGTVGVSLRRRADGSAEFEVRDTGIGMNAAEIEIALEPFGQIDSAHSRQHPGTGLGLPLARRLTELHGGTLTVRSEKGRGTTVTVTLPATRVRVAAVIMREPMAAAS